MKQEFWEVSATVQHYDPATGYIAGTMCAANVPDAEAPVQTFFEGEVRCWCCWRRCSRLLRLPLHVMTLLLSLLLLLLLLLALAALSACLTCHAAFTSHLTLDHRQRQPQLLHSRLGRLRRHRLPALVRCTLRAAAGAFVPLAPMAPMALHYPPPPPPPPPLIHHTPPHTTDCRSKFPPFRDIHAEVVQHAGRCPCE